MNLLDLGNTPISEDVPSGKDVRYEESFEALSGEVAKIGSVSASSAVDWDKVMSLSIGILEKESKHLQVASYLCYALLKTKGIGEMPTGFHILRQVMENFWDTLYPPKKRMKGRRAIITWWEEKISEFIEQSENVTWEKEKRDAMLDDLSGIDQFLGDNMEDAPLLRPLINKIKSVVNEKKEEAPPTPEPVEPATAEQAEPSPAPSSTQASSPAPAAASVPAAAPVAAPAAPAMDPDADGAAILKQGLNFLRKTATALRKLNPFDSVPYRLSRIAAWTSVQNLPPADGGKTLIPSPDAQLKESIELLSANGNWEGLVNTCEPIVGEYLFWVDLSRYVAEGMEQLGYARISEIIGTETVQFVSRMNGIETLSFSDGTPFADYETQEWLQQISRSGGQGEGGGTSGDPVKQKIGEKTAEAMSMVKEKKMDAALGILMEPLASAPSEREKFLWKLAVTRLLINARQIKIAASYIDDILAAIEIFNLEKWEPDHAIEAFSLALAGLRLQKSEQHADKIQSIIGKVSMLDPVTALKIV